MTSELWDDPTPVETALAGLRRQFIDLLPTRIEAIRANFMRLDPVVWQLAELQVLHRLVHSLTGAAGTFGMHSLSAVAHELEQHLAAMLQDEQRPGTVRWRQTIHVLERLEKLAQVRLQQNAPSLKQPHYSVAQGSPLIDVVEDDVEQARQLGMALEQDGYRVRVFTELAKFRAAWSSGERPAAVVLDMIFQQGDTAGALLPPIIVLTAQHGRDYLLRALNSGARDFVTKPFDRIELLTRVRNLLEVHQAHRLLYDQKAVLEELVQERTRQLRDTRLQIVQRLGRAAEYRDNETGFHVIRMSRVSALLARSLGWSAGDCELMLHASPMHDVGKIGIPDGILLKPGKLEPHEWEIMKQHATIGAELMDGDDSELLRLAHIIALTHHEKWDGSGYPHGLAGAAIPQAGRIVAVADVFDALTSVRPYKEAWPADKTMAYMHANIGKHFDPEVVAHFQQNLTEILAICERYAESEVVCI